MNYKFIDLFSGSGAFSYILEKYGYECVLANDILEESKLIYELNNKKNIFKIDDILNIKNEEIPSFSVLTGGFNCQPFSIAGKDLVLKMKELIVFGKL